MKFGKMALSAAALALTPFAAYAQDAGTTIYSQVDDTAVGTVEANDGATVLVDTGSYKAPLPSNAVVEREGKWTVNATKAQIDSMMAQMEAEANAKLDAALVDGAAVMSADSVPVGTILAMDEAGQQIIVANETGVISLKREHFAVNETGMLTALYTGTQLAEFTTEVPEGAIVETAEGPVKHTAEGWEMMAESDAPESSASAASMSAAGATQ
ncbi:MAG: hypothetical protein V2I27_13005 [Erythrobacter sp.]|jgi:hypothetical protein|nr:hypothetical protein [Erythrobacter sp.]